MEKRTRILKILIVTLGIIALFSISGIAQPEQYSSVSDYPEGVIHYDPFSRVNSTDGGHDPRTSFTFSNSTVINGSSLIATSGANGAKGSTYDFRARTNENFNVSFYWTTSSATTQDVLRVGTYDSSCVTDAAGGAIYGVQFYITGSKIRIRNGGSLVDFAPRGLIYNNITKFTIGFNQTGDSGIIYSNLYVNDHLSVAGIRAESQGGAGDCVPEDRADVGRIWYQMESGISFTIDDLLITNKSYRPLGAIPPPVEPSTLNGTESNPLNGTVKGLGYPTINFNITVNASYGFTGSLYINGTLNQSENFSAGKNVFVSFNASFVSSHYNYHFNLTDGIFNASSGSPKFFAVDEILPTLTTNYTNGSVYIQDIVHSAFNFADDSTLFSFNISIDGVQVAGALNLNTNYYPYNLTYDPSSLSVGNHTITARWADSHTANKLKENYGFRNGLFDDYAKYNFPEGYYIKTQLEDPSWFDRWTSNKKIDRYTQTLKPSKTSDTITLIEESDKPIHIVESQGKYKGSWIIIGDHWKDYVLKGEEDSTVLIERINEKSVRVTISGIKNQNLLEFESVGDLNINTEDFLLVKSSGLIAADSFSTHLAEQTISFSINTSSVTPTTNADFYYNGSFKASDKTSYPGYDYYESTFLSPFVPSGVDFTNISYYWQYFINGTGKDEVGTFLDSQLIYRLGLDNCTTFTMPTLNINVKDESTEAIINKSQVDGYFTAWVTSENNFASFNLTWRGADVVDPQYQLCIFPNESIYYSYAQIEYEASGYEKKLYYFDNTTFTNSSKDLNLYLTNGTSTVTFTVTDTNDNPIEDVIIKVLSYDLPTNTYKTTEILKTDSSGQSLGQIVLNSNWYAFILELDKQVVLQTTPTKITSTTKNFRLDLNTDYFTKYDTVRAISHDLNYTNSTKNFAFTWNDANSEISQACLTLVRKTALSEVQLNQSCSTSYSGIILVPISGSIDTEYTYLATSSVIIEGDYFELETYDVSFNYTHLLFSGLGIFLTFFIILTLSMIGVWHPAVGIIFSMFGLFLAVTFHLIYLGSGTMIALIIVGVIALYKLKNT